jgi:hypothetical protein
MRLDSDVIAWLKADGRGYQTKANWLLRYAMSHFRKERNLASRERRGRRVDKTSHAKGKAWFSFDIWICLLRRFSSLATLITEDWATIISDGMGS